MGELSPIDKLNVEELGLDMTERIDVLIERCRSIGGLRWDIKLRITTLKGPAKGRVRYVKGRADAQVFYFSCNLGRPYESTSFWRDEPPVEWTYAHAWGIRSPKRLARKMLKKFVSNRGAHRVVDSAVIWGEE